MANTERPLSPHLQIYKPQISSVLSIAHRGSGVFLAVGTIFLTLWLLALASGQETYQCAYAIAAAWYGQVALFLFSYALNYHLCNGIRHLFWDMGKGFEVTTANKTGYAVLIISVFLTLGLWSLICIARGAY